MALFGKLISLARSPQGRRLLSQAQKAARDPQNRERIRQARTRFRDTRIASERESRKPGAEEGGSSGATEPEAKNRP